MTSTWYVILLFTAALAIFHIILVWVPTTRLGETAWKKVDYIWLSFTLISLVSLTSEARQLLASNILSLLETRVMSAGQDFQHTLPRWEEFVCNPPYQKSELSPPNFDEMMQELSRYCDWLGEISPIIDVSIEKRQIINHPQFDVTTGQLIIVGNLEHLAFQIDSYNAALRELDQASLDAEKSEFDLMLGYFAPVLLAVALALRVTKVSGELWWSKKKAVLPKK